MAVALLLALLLALRARAQDATRAVFVDDIVVDNQRLTFCTHDPENITAAVAEFCAFHNAGNAECHEQMAALRDSSNTAWEESPALVARLHRWQRSWRSPGTFEAERAWAGGGAELAVVAQFRNEADVLGEWLAHHAREGVGHFYLIDNNSTDAPLAVLAPWLRAGRVTLFSDPRPQRQSANYNSYALPHARAHAWVASLDLDEFLYARDPAGDAARTARASVLAWLRALPSCVGSVQLPFKNFGSSARARQPASVVDGFTRRKRFIAGEAGLGGAGGAEMDLANSKVISRGAAIETFGTHCNSLHAGWLQVDGTGVRTPLIALEEEVRAFDGARGDVSAFAAFVSERHLAGAAVHLNHYTLQSRERYLRVKAARGGAEDPTLAYDAAVFEERDAEYGAVLDDELRRKRRDQLAARAAAAAAAGGVEPGDDAPPDDADRQHVREELDQLQGYMHELLRATTALQTKIEGLQRHFGDANPPLPKA